MVKEYDSSVNKQTLANTTNRQPLIGLPIFFIFFLIFSDTPHIQNTPQKGQPNHKPAHGKASLNRGEGRRAEKRAAGNGLIVRRLAARGGGRRFLFFSKILDGGQSSLQQPQNRPKRGGLHRGLCHQPSPQPHVTSPPLGGLTGPRYQPPSRIPRPRPAQPTVIRRCRLPSIH